MSQDTETTSLHLRATLRCLAGPPSVLAIALLLLNDHYLKQQYPSWLTGKLSDFAGLYFAPYLFLVVALSIAWLLGQTNRIWHRPRQRGGSGRLLALLAASVFLATGLVFGATKLSPDTALPVLRLMSSLTRLSLFVVTDPSDLLAIVMLPLAHAAWKRQLTISKINAHMPPSAGTAFGRVSQLLVLGIATMAVTATSYGPATPPTLGLAADPNDPNTLYTVFGNDVYRTVDGGKSWQAVASCVLRGVDSRYRIPVPGRPGVFYVLVQSRWIKVDPGPVQTMVAKERPREPAPTEVQSEVESDEVWKCGLSLPESVPVWAPPIPTSATSITPAGYLMTPPIVDAPVWKPDILFVAVDSKVMRTTDGGRTWATLVPSEDLGGSVTALASDPSRPGTIFVAMGSRVLRSEDSGDSWTSVGEAAEPLVGLKVHPLDSQFIVGVARNAFLVTRDGGRTWRKTDADNRQDEYRAFRGVRVIAFDPTHPRTIYVVPINYGLFMSEDGGETWSKSFDGNTVTGLVITGGPGSQVYIADSMAGVLRLRDPGRPSTAGWEPVNSNLPRPTPSSR